MKIINLKYISGAWLALLAAIILSAQGATAQEQPQFGLRPANPGSNPATSGYFVLTGQPGDTLQNAVLVANPGKIPVTLDVYAVDAVTGQQGGANYLTLGEPVRGVGSWVKLDKTQVDLQAGQQIVIPFSVVVPPNVGPGQHLGGIAVQPKQTAAGSSSVGANFGVKTVARAITAVQVNVGGDTFPPSLKITGAQVKQDDATAVLTLTLNNDGKVMVKPRGEVTLLDQAGQTVLNSKLAIDTFVPQTTINYPVQAELPATAGTYTVKAVLDYGGSAPATFEGPVTIIGRSAAATTTAAARNTAVVAAAPAAQPQAPAVAPVQAQPVKANDSGSMMLGILIGIAAMLTLAVGSLSVYVLKISKPYRK